MFLIYIYLVNYDIKDLLIYVFDLSYFFIWKFLFINIAIFFVLDIFPYLFTYQIHILKFELYM